ncbi:MAG: HAD-IG family 5'-nucleotidase [Deltaproteobacteria bacterium]|nr:HAD-IG family 5'-nucleotidase [Deltaproteobacteria bacterium]
MQRALEESESVSVAQGGQNGEHRIYVNRSLKMEQIEWVGFDMDYTLAIYRQSEIDRLSIDATVKKLIDRGYPPELALAKFDEAFPLRGLFIDKQEGNLLKMDRYKFVAKAFHGSRELSRERRRELYHAQKIRVDSQRYHWIDTLYALPEAAVYTGAIDFFDGLGAQVDYEQLFTDIRESIDEAHRDGAIVDVIEANLPRFVARDPALATALHKLRSAGKKLFLLTNSRAGYTDSMMTFLLQGALSEYPSWQHYFDVVVGAASKPRFFTERRPFMEWRGRGEASTPTMRLERLKVYEGGNLVDFERLIGARSDSVLYVGDHIYGDILRSKKDSAWRTLMIIQEMDDELVAIRKSGKQFVELDELESRRESLIDELRVRQQRLRALERDVSATPESDSSPRRVEKRTIDALRSSLREDEERHRALRQEIDQQFHSAWGSLFKEGVEVSSFGDQVEEYACLYTSRASNLGCYSPMHYFRSPRDAMPHERGTP